MKKTTIILLCIYAVLFIMLGSITFIPGCAWPDFAVLAGIGFFIALIENTMKWRFLGLLLGGVAVALIVSDLKAGTKRELWLQEKRLKTEKNAQPSGGVHPLPEVGKTYTHP